MKPYEILLLKDKNNKNEIIIKLRI